jgi:hypothetical protein
VGRNGHLGLLLGLAWSATAAAQCSSAPASFTATCTQLEGYLSSFNSTIQSQWNGSQPPVAFGAELTAADANRGLSVLISPTSIHSVELQLDGLVNVGVQTVVVGVSFPILYPPFYQYNNDPQDYATVVSFYQKVMTQARQRGLKVVVEASVLFPDMATDLPLTAYYATLSSDDVTAGRGQNALNVAQLLAPDWLNLGSEPDTQAALLGLSQPYTPQQYAAEISTIVAQLRGAGINGKPLVGAGVGTWSPNATDFISDEVGTGLDYIDLHIYSVNLGFLADAATDFDLAIMSGKGVALSEAWMRKVNDSQLEGLGDFGIESLLSSSTTTSLDNFSFWSPLDSEFLTDLADLAYWKNLYYISPYPIQFLFAYLDYNSTIGMTPDQINAAETPLFTAALQNGTLSATGEAYSALIKTVAVPNVVGLTQASATTAITGAGLTVGTVTGQSSNSAAFGEVISESPAAGTMVNLASAVNLVVSIGPPLAISGPSSLPIATVGVAYSATVTATGGSGTYQWSASGLPSGLGIGLNSGTISGTPATGSGSPFAVKVAASDANSTASISATYNLIINLLSVCGVAKDGGVHVADVQLMIGEALGLAKAANDLNGDGVVNVADVQIVVAAALGEGCSASQ